ncbi:MAG: DUF1634 domain-containing protein [Chloroflexales bacterium]|nr:DUF1634 domain-containing protein [Chloroflexales bacterium]
MQREPLVESGFAGGQSRAGAPAKQPDDPSPLVTPDLPAEAREHSAGRMLGGRAPGIHVAPDITRQVLTPEPGPGAQERRDLDGVVHRVLILGLVLSSALMLAGIGLELARGTALPEAVAGLGQVLPRVLSLRPSGFLTLGLLVLIATPILRVVGSVIAFLAERDWRFAGITGLVLLVMVVSIVLGKG